MAKKDDSELFREFVGDVEPLKQTVLEQKKSLLTDTPGLVERRRAAQASDEKTGNYLARQEFIEPVKPWDLLSFKRDGVQHGVFRHFKQGRYGIDASIDLHGRTVAQARQEVFEFLRECTEQNIRCAMITHGKGLHRDPPALLKSCVNHWLQQVDEVLAFHSSAVQHGGSGSTYVLLRKSLAMAEKNREKFAVKSNR
jgi:DNA-nicking Smr family endonuclease